MSRLRITYRSSVYAGRELAFDVDAIRLGRDPQNHVPFDEHADRSVSRLHAEIKWEGGAPVLHPNAGRVILRYGRPVTGPTLLAPGDILEFAGAGGPSIEVQFERQASSAPKVIGHDDVDAAGATITGMPAFIAGEGFVGAKAVEPPAPAPPPQAMFEIPSMPAVAPAPLPPAPMAFAPPPPPPPPAPAPAPVSMTFQPPPDPRAAPMDFKGTAQLQAQSGTAMMRALENDGIHQTQYIAAPVVLPGAKPEPRRVWLYAVIGGAGLVVAILVAFVASSMMDRADRRRQAIERVEKLRAALASSGGVAPAVSAEDWAIYEEEMAKAPKPASGAAKAVVGSKADIEALKAAAAAAAAEDARLKAEADAARQAAEAERKRVEASTADLRKQAREVFARIRRSELRRIGLGKGRDRPTVLKREQLGEERAAAIAEYDGIIAKLTAEVKPGRQEELIRTLSRYLGECDGAMPAKFLAEVNAAVSKLKGDRAQREALEGALDRSAKNRFGPTITAALGDQSVPVEFFFVPLRESGFDAAKEGEPTASGPARGMWQLSPAAAQRYGLAVAEGGDERQKYEKEARAAAKLVREQYLGPAAGSALLVMAAWDHGEAGALAAIKKKAGLGADDGDPGRVSFWRVYEAGALDEARRKAVIQLFALMLVASAPGEYGFAFPVPLEHVALAE